MPGPKATKGSGKGNGGTAIPLTRPFRRGRKFGTIIVDLRTHRVLDVLPDRTAERVAAWMAAHSEIEWEKQSKDGWHVIWRRSERPLLKTSLTHAMRNESSNV